MATRKDIAEAREKVIIAATAALREAKGTFKRADDIRKDADAKGRLLKPTDIIDGRADAGKLWRYMTTDSRGGVRPITLADVLDFDKRRRALGSKFGKGIKAKDVIDLARAVVPGQKASDLDKAREQIHTAVPVATKAGELRFATNASAGSDATRHYVTIKMLNFEAAVASPTEPMAIVREVTHGPLAIGCTCGQWRFVYAYMATAGGYGLPNHRETAFPKLKNAKLVGVACKHLVKVASVLIQSPTVKGYIAKLIEAERNKTQSKLTRNKIAEMKRIAEAMQKDRNKTIKTTDEKRAARAKLPSSIKAAQEKAARMAKRADSAAKIELELKKAESALRLAGFGDAAVAAALAARRKEMLKAL